MRYYSPMRPVGPGTIPVVLGNRVEQIVNFDRREYVDEIGREAWGYIEYRKELDPELSGQYELVAPIINPA